MYTQLNQYHVILEAQPNFTTIRQAEQDLHPGQCLLGGHRRGRQHFLLRLGLGLRRFECNHRVGPLHPFLRSAHAAQPASPWRQHQQHRLQFRQHQHQLHSQQRCSAGRLHPHWNRARNRSRSTTRANSLRLRFPSTWRRNAALGDAIAAINKAAKDMNFPASVQAGFQGTAASFENSLSTMKRC